MDIHPSSITHDDNKLTVEWTDGHRSIYPADWLSKNTPAGIKARVHHPRLWDSSLGNDFPVADYSEVQESDLARLKMLKQLVDFGAVRIANVSTDIEQTERLANLISIIRETPHGRIYDVRSLPNVHNLAYGSDELSLHTDGSYHYYTPGIILFHFIETTQVGGETILVDGFKAAEALRGENPEAFKLLCKTPWHNAYSNAGMDIRASQPAIGINGDGDLTHVILNQYTSFPSHFDHGEISAIYQAWRQIHEIASRPDLQVKFKMSAGDAVLFDNRRVLHTRTGFDASKEPRRLRHCYMDRDTLHSNLRILAKKLGEPIGEAIFTAI